MQPMKLHNLLEHQFEKTKSYQTLTQTKLWKYKDWVDADTYLKLTVQ